MIVEIFKCPQCGKEARVADIDISGDIPGPSALIKKKIIVLCLECNDVPVMQRHGTEIRDSEGNVGAVIV